MLEIDVMIPSQIDFGLHLCNQARWNQNEADWRRFLAIAPESCFIAKCDGQLAGTAAAFVFGKVAWIAMVLVDEAARGKGIGTALMKHTLGWLDEKGIPSVRLDATHLGKPIYEKLGFESQFELARYEGTPGNTQPPSDDVLPMMETDLQEAIATDRTVTNTDRRPLLEQLYAQSPQHARIVGSVGYLMVRPGNNAWQIGPAIGEATACELLLADAWRRFENQRVFVDVPLDNEAAVRSVQAAGLTEQRRFTRMCRGEQINDDVSKLWLSSGPEKG